MSRKGPGASKFTSPQQMQQNGPFPVGKHTCICTALCTVEQTRKKKRKQGNDESISHQPLHVHLQWCGPLVYRPKVSCLSKVHGSPSSKFRAKNTLRWWVCWLQSMFRALLCSASCVSKHTYPKFYGAPAEYSLFSFLAANLYKHDGHISNTMCQGLSSTVIVARLCDAISCASDTNKNMSNMFLFCVERLSKAQCSHHGVRACEWLGNGTWSTWTSQKTSKAGKRNAWRDGCNSFPIKATPGKKKHVPVCCIFFFSTRNSIYFPSSQHDEFWCLFCEGFSRQLQQCHECFAAGDT